MFGLFSSARSFVTSLRIDFSLQRGSCTSVLKSSLSIVFKTFFESLEIDCVILLHVLFVNSFSKVSSLLREIAE